MIKAILCMTKNRCIGTGNSLPWNEPDEMQHFVKTTTNHTLMMGRTTYEGLFKSGLPNRKLLILSRSLPPGPYKNNKNVEVVNNIHAIINQYQNSEKILFICGGKQLYDNLWQYCDEIILSVLKKNYQGDVFLKPLPLSDFKFNKKIKKNNYNVYYYLKK